MALDSDIQASQRVRAEQTASVDSLFEALKEAKKDQDDLLKKQLEIQQKDADRLNKAILEGAPAAVLSTGMTPLSSIPGAEEARQAVLRSKVERETQELLRREFVSQSMNQMFESGDPTNVENISRVGIDQAMQQALATDELQQPDLQPPDTQTPSPAPSQAPSQAGDQAPTSAPAQTTGRASSATDPSNFQPEPEVVKGRPVPGAKERNELRKKAFEQGVEAAGGAEAQTAKSQAKAKEAALQTSEAAQPFLKTFQLAHAEIVEELGEEADDATVLGAGIRVIGNIKNALGLLPETKAFTDQIEAFATPLAKSAGEDRLTNEDIKRFVRLIPNVLGGSREENVKKIRNFVNTLQYKSGTDQATKDRIKNNFIKSFRAAGGTLADAADAIESFEEDVARAGKKLGRTSLIDQALSDIDKELKELGGVE